MLYVWLFLSPYKKAKGEGYMTINKTTRGVTAKLALLASAILLTCMQVRADVLNPVIGPILYEENFNTLDSTLWNTVEGDGCGIGLCGWGNAELENYHAANLTIENPPFEPATKALAITAKRETLGTSSYTARSSSV
jgi:hypothetical protein